MMKKPAILVKGEKISAEIFTLTYGAMISQIVKDYENLHDINAKIEEFGYNMGKRLVDEFLAKSGKETCQNFRDVADTLGKDAFLMFLGTSAEVYQFSDKENSFSLILKDNPLNDYVELPESLSQIQYSNVICGAIRGALELLQYKVKATIVKDTLKGDDVNEFKVELKEIIQIKIDE